MKTNGIQKIGFICLLLLLVSCNYKRANTAVKDTSMNDTLTYTGCQEKINLGVGTILKIKLEAIAGTGYQWLLKESTPLLQEIGEDSIRFIYPDGKENIPGHQGYQVLEFKAIQKGKGILQLEYRRVFEKGVEKSCVIQIEIK